MKVVYVRGLAIGEGRPKICIPICGKTKTEIIDEAKKILEFLIHVMQQLQYYLKALKPIIQINCTSGL